MTTTSSNHQLVKEGEKKRKTVLECLKALVKYHEEPDWAKEQEQKAAEITDGNCSYLDVLLYNASAAIKDIEG